MTADRKGKYIRTAFLCVLGILLSASCQGQQSNSGKPTRTAVNIVFQSPTVAPNGSPSTEPAPSTTPDLPLSGVIIGLDPGHQSKANTKTEPNAPGSSVMKAKVTGGTYGRFSHVSEYEVNLLVGLKLQKLLTDAGATVIMTRTTHDVNLSNVERAQIFNNEKVDLGIRIHCNGNDNSSAQGVSILVPKKNPFLEDCQESAESILDEVIAATGAQNDGVVPRGDQTGFNWCERAVITIEMGYMTNKNEDLLLTSDKYQDKLTQGMYNGILKFFTK